VVPFAVKLGSSRGQCSQLLVADPRPFGMVLSEIPLKGFVTIPDGFAKDIEIKDGLETIARFIGEEMLPQLKKFFS
jgi:hypothetical protein